MEKQVDLMCKNCGIEIHLIKDCFSGYCKECYDKLVKEMQYRMIEVREGRQSL